MPSSLLRLAAVSLAGISCLVSPVAGKVFEQLAAVPDGWKYVGTPKGNQPIRLKIALHQHDVAGFEQALVDMSTPGHSNYGNHFQSYEEMKQHLLPTEDTLETVQGWLSFAGITNIEEDADWINIRTTVEEANSLLQANFLWYANEDESMRILRTLEYSVPQDVVGHINMIQPTTRFGQLHPNRATLHTEPQRMAMKSLAAAVNSGYLDHCENVTTPTCLQELYSTTGYKADASRGSKIGFASYLEEYARYSDLSAFEENLAPYAVGQSFSVVQFNGGLNDQNSPHDSGEANLDLQYIVGMSSPLPVTEYSTGGRGKLVPDLSEPDVDDNSNEPYLEFLEGILKLDQKDLPQVLSTSYGEDEQTIPENYARAVCTLFGQLGSRGVSVIFSSGDSGVGSACQTNEVDESERRTHFPPQFPASCPWVTSVGGTSGIEPEKAVFFSSGGFSDYWERPSYQQEAVEKFLGELGNTWSEYFNRNGRGFPDVAAHAVNYAVVNKGNLNLYEGTSCSAPVFSAIIALLNDARLANNKPVMGFLNPWLYSDGLSGLTDITLGGSTGCDGFNRFGGSPNGSPVIPYASWNATEGWDPVTGLGTPNFRELLRAAGLPVA